jgi:hypothetical protein
MSTPESVNRKDGVGRDVYYLTARTLDSITGPDFPGRYFTLFIAADFSVYNVGDLNNLAKKMLDAGVVYVCTWGNDCEKMHDIFDEIIVEREIDKGGDGTCILTTWHSKDTLDEALWFALCSAFPDDKYKDMCRSILAMTIGDTTGDLVRTRLMDIQKLNRDILNDSSNG